MRILYIFILIPLLAVSCISQKQSLKKSPELSDSGSCIVPVPKPEQQEKYLLSFSSKFIILNEDTVLLSRLECFTDIDTLEFSKILNSSQSEIICFSDGYQGKDYYSVQIDSTGKFNELVNLRTFNINCQSSVEKHIIETLKETKVLSKEYYNSKFIFQYEVMIYY